MGQSEDMGYELQLTDVTAQDTGSQGAYINRQHSSKKQERDQYRWLECPVRTVFPRHESPVGSLLTRAQ
jgi:hypothetical protein